MLMMASSVAKNLPSGLKSALSVMSPGAVNGATRDVEVKASPGPPAGWTCDGPGFGGPGFAEPGSASAVTMPAAVSTTAAAPAISAVRRRRPAGDAAPGAGGVVPGYPHGADEAGGAGGVAPGYPHGADGAGGPARGRPTGASAGGGGAAAG